MSIYDENVALIKRLNPRAGWRKMITGLRTDTATVTMVGAPAGRFWARWPDASRAKTAIVGFYGTANHTIWVAPNASGALEFKEIAEETRAQFTSNEIAAAAQPPKPAELNRDLLPDENLIQLRVRPASASVTVLVEAGFYRKDDGTLNAIASYTKDLSASVPGYSSGLKQFRWVLVSLDRSTGTYSFTNGTASTLELTDADLAAITPPTGSDPFYGVLLESGLSSFYNPKAQFRKINALGGGGGGGGGAVEVQSNSVTVESAATLFNFGPEFVIGNPVSGSVTVNGPTGGATIWAEVLIYDKTLSANGTFDTNTADDSGRTGIVGYTDLRAQIVGKSSTATDQYLRPVFNADTTVTNYKTQMMFASGTGGGNASRYYFNSNTVMGVSMSTAPRISVIGMTILGYSNTSDYKMARFTEARLSATTVWETTQPVFWLNTAAITRLQFSVDSVTNFAAGSRLQVWGIKEVSVGMPVLSDMAVAGTMPTAAELAAEFPSAPDGFAAYINDGGANTDFFHVWKQGGNWIAIEGTKV